jgi:hypothetical protein
MVKKTAPAANQIQNQPLAAAQKPSFMHHDKVIEGLNMIFGSTWESVKISDSSQRLSPKGTELAKVISS